MSLYDKASLIMTPSGAKATKLYSHKPHNGNGDFTHDRNAGTATRVNKDGYIETVAADVPRLDYPLIDGVVQDCPALLLEPARTNLFQRSQEFDNTYWTSLASGETITANSVLSPDGTQNADTLEGDGSSTNVYVRADVTLTSAADCTFSIFAKKGTNNFLAIEAAGFTSATNTIVIFDLNDGVVITGTADIKDYGNGWYRCSYTIGISTDLVGRFLIYSAYGKGTRGFPSASDANGQSIYLWGAMLENNSDYVSSYIPTTTATVTRNADVCDSAGTSAEFNDSEGVLYVEAAALFNDGTNRFIAISDGSNDDRVQIIYSSSNDTINSSVIFGNTSQCSFSEGSITTTDFNKLAIKYKEDDFAFWFNGFEKDTDSDGSTPLGLNTLGLERPTNVSRFLGRIKEVATFKTALTDSELEQLTSWDSFTEMATSQEYSIR